MTFPWPNFRRGAGTLIFFVIALFPLTGKTEPLNKIDASVTLSSAVTDNAWSQTKYCTVTLLSCKDNALYFIIEPDISFARRFSFGRVWLQGGLLGFLYAYDDDKFQNASNSLLRDLEQVYGNAEAGIEAPLGSRFRIELVDRFYPGSIGFGDTATSRTNYVQTNIGEGKLRYDFPLVSPWDGFLMGRLTRTDIFNYDNLFTFNNVDRLEYGANGRLDRKVGRRSRLSLEGDIAHTKFDDESALLVDFTSLGSNLTWNFKPRRQFELILGGGVAGYLSRAGDNFGWTLLSSIRWNVTGRTQIFGQVSRVHTNQIGIQAFTISSTNLTIPGIRFSSLSAVLEASHKLTRRVTLEIRTNFRQSRNLGNLVPLANEYLFSFAPSVTIALGKHFETQLRYEHARTGTNPFGNSLMARNEGVWSLTARY